MKTGIEIIAEERQRQQEVEGWTPEHDDNHQSEELARAAAYYATPRFWRPWTTSISILWPWSSYWWKPSPDNRIKELAKAGALIAAEIDRLQRKTQ
jgi:hypothetical protein